MSELKVHKIGDLCFDFKMGKDVGIDFYLKSEADKVISEKDEEITVLKDKSQMHDFFWEGCSFAKRGFKNTIAVSEAFDTLEAENESLLQQNRELCQAMQVMYSKEEYDKQKHKRCLDKAEMCKARYDAEDARVNGHGASWDYTSDEMKYWERWQKRWLELAEKFKEAK